MYLENTYKTVNTVLKNIKNHVNDLVMASKGIVTVSLLSLDELNSIIHDARVQFGVTPIFNSAQITLYYQVMKVPFFYSKQCQDGHECPYQAWAVK